MSDNNKPHRNGPCPCGSGRKYKKCCMESDNTAFSPEEQLRNNQAMLLFRLEGKKRVMDMDIKHLTAACEEIRAQVAVIESMPYTNGQGDIITELNNQIAQIEKAAAGYKTPWSVKVDIATLRQVVRQEDEVVEEKLEVPTPAHTIQKPGPFGPKMGPIQTDEDDDIDDDD